MVVEFAVDWLRSDFSFKPQSGVSMTLTLTLVLRL